ncbi:MAG TPA: hypothetical protein VIM81_07950 [Gammaproteobacteria bacterium]
MTEARKARYTIKWRAELLVDPGGQALAGLRIEKLDLDRERA